MNKAPQQEGWPNFALAYTRTWRGRLRSATLLVSLAATYALVFHMPFPQEDHVFVRARRWHSRLLRDLFG